MARLSFTVRKTVLGGSGVQQVHPDHVAAGDSDIALRSDDFIYPIQPLGSIGQEDSWLDVLAIDYGVIRLAWSIGIELDVPFSGLTLTELRIVFSDEGTPRAVSDGQTILVLTKDRWAESYDHAISEHAFTQQPWAYYSLFGRFTDGASVWYERLASVSELVPTDQGSHAALYRRIPRHYQMLDEQIAIETDQVDGPLSQFLELFAFEADKHRTLAQQLWRINDPDFTHEQALVALSHQMGLHVDTTDIPAKFLRNILANYGFLRERKGTLIGAMAYLNALTECPISVVSGHESSPTRQQYTFLIHAQRVNLIRTPRFLFGPGTGNLWTAYHGTTTSTTGLTWDQGTKTLTNTTGSTFPVMVSPATSIRVRPGVPYFGSVQITTSTGTALDAGTHAPFIGISDVDPALAAPVVPANFAIEPTTIDPVTREVRSQTYSTTGATVLVWPYFTFNLAAGESVVLDRWMLQPYNRGPYFDGNHELGGFINDNQGNIAKDYRWTGSANQSSSIFTEYLSHKRAAVLKSLDFFMPALFVLADVTKHEYRFLFNALPGDDVRLQEQGLGTVIGRWPPVPAVAEEIPFFGGGLTQIAFRGRVNNGGEATATWKAPLNTGWDQPVDQVFRLRFAIKNDAMVSDTSDWQLFYSADGGETWTAATATSNVVRTAASIHFTDGAATLQRISNGPFAGGIMDEGDGFAGNRTLTAGAIAEFEYSLTLRSADVVNGQEIMLRLHTGNWQELDSYLEIATVTAIEP